MTIYDKYGDTKDCSALSEWISRIQRREEREGYELCDSFECKEQAVTGKKCCTKHYKIIVLGENLCEGCGFEKMNGPEFFHCEDCP